MILNKRFCFRIHFFKIDIQYIDKYSIERKCMPYIPEYGKVQTISKDNVTWIWRVWDTKPIEAHTSPWGHGLHGTMVWYTGTFLIAVPSRSDLNFLFFFPISHFPYSKVAFPHLMNTPFFLHIPYISALSYFLHSITLKIAIYSRGCPKIKINWRILK